MVKPFIDNAFELHSHAKVFVLPAEKVFLNYSLLESMSCGTVPVVTKGEGWDKIITNENGFASSFDYRKFADNIKLALNQDIWHKKSINARETIKNYDIKIWGKKALEFKEVLTNI
jgi:glycosyltransferase involved in cell wall biosynthesis